MEIFFGAVREPDKLLLHHWWEVQDQLKGVHGTHMGSTISTIIVSHSIMFLIEIKKGGLVGRYPEDLTLRF